MELFCFVLFCFVLTGSARWPSLMMTLFVLDSKTIRDFRELCMVLIEVWAANSR
jgi:hypothetical protein